MIHCSIQITQKTSLEHQPFVHSRSRVDLDSRKRWLSVAARTACTIVRAAQSIDYAEPSVAQRKPIVGGEIHSLAKVYVNKVAIFLRNRMECY